MCVLIIEDKKEKRKYDLTAKFVARKSLNFTDICIDSGVVYWTESRPLEAGKSFIVSYDSAGRMVEETTEDFHVSAGVHGYGGGAFSVKDNTIYFFDNLSSQIFKKNRETNVFSKITFGNGYLYGDFCVDNAHDYIYCIRLNKNKKSKFPPTEIVRVEISTGNQEILFSGADFYSNVRINSTTTNLIFIQWNYPNMPWDENELWMADIRDNKNIENPIKIYHKKNISVYQPEFINNRIVAVVNENNYWQLCEYKDNVMATLFSYPADFGRPLWLLGSKTYAFISNHEIIANCCENGIWKTFLINLLDRKSEVIKNELTCINNLAADHKTIAFIAGNPKMPLDICVSSISNKSKVYALRGERETAFQDSMVSKPQLIEFRVKGKNLFAFFYPATNSQVVFQNGEKPLPCILKVHGGPTSCADFLYNSKIQYYTSRGFNYVELNYSGSSGHGKSYRQRLNGAWGVVDVQDTIACAEYLCDTNLADKNNLILCGSSAGGFTLLNVLVKSNLFKCASCHYGVADLEALAKSAHKFEACYDQSLIGDSIENNRELYRDRSPINHVQQISTPIIFFHGDKDSVVHMDQSIQIAQKLKEQNVYHEIHLFQGEGHGFKKEETIAELLEKELRFFKKYI